MQRIVPQNFYTPIEILPQPKSGYSRLSAIVQTVAFNVFRAIYVAAIGGFIGLTIGTAHCLEMAILFGLVSFVALMTHALFFPLPTVFENYRIGTLDQLKTATINPRALVALTTLKDFLSYPLTGFSHYFDLPLFYREITAVTDRLDPQRRDTIDAWRLFLQHLHGTKVKLPGGEMITLDLSREYRCLRNRLVQKSREVVKQSRETVTSFWLTGRFAFLREAPLQQIDEIQKEVLSPDERYSPNELRAAFKNKNNHCIASRDASTNEIVGFGWYFDKGKGEKEIGGLCRKAIYTGLGIGNQLLAEILAQFRDSDTVTVRMRKSNPAIDLFKQFGFEEDRDLPDDYSRYPKEDGKLLKLNWEKYHQITNAQKSS